MQITSFSIDDDTGDSSVLFYNKFGISLSVTAYRHTDRIVISTEGVDYKYYQPRLSARIDETPAKVKQMINNIHDFAIFDNLGECEYPYELVEAIYEEWRVDVTETIIRAIVRILDNGLLVLPFFQPAINLRLNAIGKFKLIDITPRSTRIVIMPKVNKNITGTVKIDGYSDKIKHKFLGTNHKGKNFEYNINTSVPLTLIFYGSYDVIMQSKTHWLLTKNISTYNDEVDYKYDGEGEMTTNIVYDRNGNRHEVRCENYMAF